MSSTRHCTWPLLIQRRNSVVYSDVSSCTPLTSLWLILNSGWSGSYRECMKILVAKFVLVVTWLKSSVWKWVSTKSLAWAHYYSWWFWKPSAKSLIEDVPWETYLQVTWSSSLNRLGNYKRRWSSGRLSWKERDFGSTWAKPRSWYMYRGSMCFRSLASEVLSSVSQQHWNKLHFLWWLFQGGSQEMQWNLYLWPCEASSQLRMKTLYWTGQTSR